MSPLNHKSFTSSLAPPIFYVAKNEQLKDRRFPISTDPQDSSVYGDEIDLTQDPKRS